MVDRLLLIEDDHSIARFVEMALEELPGLQLTNVRSLADARAALDTLSRLGARARLVALPSAHWVSVEMVVELRRFLDERLPAG